MKSQTMYKGANFGEYLLGHDLDCELIIADCDSAYSFVHDKGDNFTDEGKQKFAPILNASFELLENGNIVVNCDDEELGELFLAAYAGYIANTQFVKWFKE